MRKIAVLLALALGAVSPALVSVPSSARAIVVNVKVSTTTVDVGQLFTVSGKVTGAKKGDIVKVQVKAPGTARWTTVKKLALNTRLKYSTKIALKTPGSNGVRAVRGTLKSPTLTVTAYTWLRLGRQSLYAVTFSPWVLGTTTLGSTAYPDSIWSTGAGSWYFHLDRCTSIRYVAGRSGDAATVQGQFNAFVETSHEGGGDPNQALHPITADPVSFTDAIPENDTLLSLSVQDFEGAPVAALGTPEVHCAAAALPAMHPADLGF